MGFGYLLLGYLISLNFVYESLTLLPALGIMYLGLRRLSLYNRPLREALLWFYPTVAVSAVSFATELLRMGAVLAEETHAALSGILLPLTAVLLLFFHERLLTGIGLLAEETELPKLFVRARRNRFFSILVYGILALLYLPIRAEWFVTLNAAAFLPMLVARFVTLLLNALLIGSAYRLIAAPEDVDMERKKTGIAWLDNMREENDRREAEKTAEKKKALADIYHAREQKYREKQKNKRTKK